MSLETARTWIMLITVLMMSWTTFNQSERIATLELRIQSLEHGGDEDDEDQERPIGMARR